MPVNTTIFTTVYNIFILGASFEGNQCVSSSTQALACSRRSYSGERCKVKKEMKSREELSPSLVFIFSRSFLLDTAPHYLTTWNRLPRHSFTTFLWCTRVCEVSKWYSLKGKNSLRGVKFWTAAQPVPRNPEMPSTEYYKLNRGSFLYSFGVFCLIIHNQERLKLFKTRMHQNPDTVHNHNVPQPAKVLFIHSLSMDQWLMQILHTPGSIHCNLRWPKS